MLPMQADGRTGFKNPRDGGDTSSAFFIPESRKRFLALAQTCVATGLIHSTVAQECTSTVARCCRA